jgi:hypothetical protein
VDIKVIDLEIKQIGRIFDGKPRDIAKHLVDNGYEFHSKIADLDAVFVKKGYLDEINEL